MDQQFHMETLLNADIRRAVFRADLNEHFKAHEAMRSVAIHYWIVCFSLAFLSLVQIYLDYAWLLHFSCAVQETFMKFCLAV